MMVVERGALLRVTTVVSMRKLLFWAAREAAPS